MAVTKINKPGNTRVLTPVLLGGVYNYVSGSSEGEIKPIKVTTDGKLITDNTFNEIYVGSGSFGNITSSLILLDDTVWDDLRVPLSGTKVGSAKIPGFEVFRKDTAGTSQGVYCYQFDTTSEEELFFAVQLPHKYKLGTDLHPHIHWGVASTPAGGTTVRWGLEYSIANSFDVFPATEMLYTVTTDPVTQYKHHITEFGIISGSAIDDVSTMLLCRVFRDVANDDFAADAGAFEVDLHYEIDSLGSRDEYIK